MSVRTAEAAYTIQQAAELKNVSAGYVRAAIRSTGEPDENGRRVAPLDAKRVGKGYRISASALEAWFDSLDDA